MDKFTKKIGSESVQAHADELLAKMDESSVGVLSIKRANEWLVQASKRPKPKDLYLGIWHEGEFCIFFADTGQGKTIFAVEMGVRIAENGEVVLYIDFELSDKQFENRYSNNYSNHFNFPDNFFRAEINTDETDYKEAGFTSIEEYIAYSIEKAIKEISATVLIIDNITYLRTETEKARDALPLMKHLKALKKKHNLSILCLAHTPKRDMTRPITVNDMAGSKMLMNFCDSAFTIGQSSQDTGLRYLKQIKVREAEATYHSENVAVYQIVKPDNFLHFEFVCFSTEREHLKELTEKDKTELKEKVKELRDAGCSMREIATQLNVPLARVQRIIEKHVGVSPVSTVSPVSRVSSVLTVAL